jgi:hypothetical protein
MFAAGKVAKRLKSRVFKAPSVTNAKVPFDLVTF